MRIPYSNAAPHCVPGCFLLLVSAVAFASEPNLPETHQPHETAPTAAPSEAVMPADPAAGAAKAAFCIGCHGADGNSPNPMWPKLAGQRAEYIVKQLLDFKAGRRVDPMMTAMAAPLSGQDIVNLAAHFSQLPKSGAAGDPSKLAVGERLYVYGRPEEKVLACIACHGVEGEGFAMGIDGGFPAISAQNPAYLAKQLKSFRSEGRANDWEGVMRLVTADLSDDEINALIAYITSLGSEERRDEIAAQR